MSEQPSLRERVAEARKAHAREGTCTCRCGWLPPSTEPDGIPWNREDCGHAVEAHVTDSILAAVSAHITEGLDEAVDAFRRRIEAEAEPGVEFVEAWAREDVMLAVHTLGLLPSPEQEQSGMSARVRDDTGCPVYPVRT